MDINIQLCGKRGSERSFDSYHRMFSPCKICATRRISENYQIHRDKFLEKQRLYYQNKQDRIKDPKTQKNNLQKYEIRDFKNQINTLPEMIKSNISGS